jgi:TIR domain-containing protein
MDRRRLFVSILLHRRRVCLSRTHVSYSKHDDAFVKRLYADLQGKGVRCWFAPEDLKIGEKIRTGIDESIQHHDKLLLVLSRHAVASQWVEQEVETALEKERKEHRTVLFPIRLDDDIMEIESGWPALIRNTRNIGDFTHWKSYNAYQKALGRLLHDLKAAKEKGQEI